MSLSNAMGVFNLMEVFIFTMPHSVSAVINVSSGSIKW